MAAYEDNFGYYDLDSRPRRNGVFRLRQKPERAATMLALLRFGAVAARSPDLRAMLRRDGIRRGHRVRPKRGADARWAETNELRRPRR
jgi:hypothetical protein